MNPFLQDPKDERTIPIPTVVAAVLQGANSLPQLTDEQDHILSALPERRKNAVIRARAGSGKTFILKKLAALFPKLQILYVTFSRELVKEAEGANLPKNVTIKTAHGLAYQAAKKFYCPSKPLATKEYFRNEDMWTLLNDPLFDLENAVDEEGNDCREAAYQMRKTFLDLLNFAKVNMVDPKNQEQLDELVEYYGIAVGAERGIFYKHLVTAMQWSLKPSGNITFTEMVHTPLQLNLELPQFDLILADEIQDSSVMLMTLYERCLKPGGFIVGVGDDRQAIYGFAGSRNEALTLFAERFQCEEYKLSVNFRCGSKHIELAQRVVPDIVAHNGAIEGVVNELDDFDYEQTKVGDLIICRTNAPLVAPCLRLVRSGVKANIKGRDVAGPIATILDKVQGLNINAAMDKVLKLEETEVAIANKRRAKTTAIDAICDRFAIVRDFLADSGTVKEAKDKLFNIFSDDTPGVIFSSAHKSKGLEADRVFILNCDKIRISRPDMREWQFEQEANLEYVALTRPRQQLTLISSKNEKNNNEES